MTLQSRKITGQTQRFETKFSQISPAVSFHTVWTVSVLAVVHDQSHPVRCVGRMELQVLECGGGWARHDGGFRIATFDQAKRIVSRGSPFGTLASRPSGEAALADRQAPQLHCVCSVTLR